MKVLKFPKILKKLIFYAFIHNRRRKMEKPIKNFKKINFYAFTYNRRNKNRKCDKNHKFFYKLKNKEIAIQ